MSKQTISVFYATLASALFLIAIILLPSNYDYSLIDVVRGVSIARELTTSCISIGFVAVISLFVAYTAHKDI